MSVFTNISCYKFAALDHLDNLRQRLLALCQSSGLKGTILLSPEGINLFVAGHRDSVNALVAEIRTVNGLDTLQPKYSESDHQPFTRMLVRIKKEIIAFGVEGIDPASRPSPKLAAATLKQWLDEGRPITLLDTRNDYEIKLGTFEGAMDLGIDHFRSFPEAVENLPESVKESLKESPVVMFCTGGIRCEKAGPFMEAAGFQNIFQLDGGILKYFEECGGAHYRGECFVFDQRVGVDPALRETDSSQCYVCQSPLNAEEQADPKYVDGVSCPHCFREAGEKMRHRIINRHAILAGLSNPLPGSRQRDVARPVRVPATSDGLRLSQFLASIFPEIDAIELCASGRVLDAEGVASSGERIISAGENYHISSPAPPEPEVKATIQILYEDDAVIVLEKPAPLPVVPGGPYQHNTLQFLLSQAYAPDRPRPANTLATDESGLMVWGRSRRFTERIRPTLETSGGSQTDRWIAFTHPLTQAAMHLSAPNPTL